MSGICHSRRLSRAGGHLEQQMTLPMIKRQPRSTVPGKGASLCNSASLLSPCVRHKAMAGDCCMRECYRTPLMSGWSQQKDIDSFSE